MSCFAASAHLLHCFRFSPLKRQESLPKVQVSIFNLADEVTIKVSDQAGGIPSDRLEHV
jgi:hypothetical protein